MPLALFEQKILLFSSNSKHNCSLYFVGCAWLPFELRMKKTLLFSCERNGSLYFTDGRGSHSNYLWRKPCCFLVDGMVNVLCWMGVGATRITCGVNPVVFLWTEGFTVLCYIYKLLDKYQLVGYILTFLKDALFPSRSVWRAILRQHVLQSKTQTMEQELMHNGNEWLSPNVVGTNRVSKLWSICRNAPSISPVCRKLLRIVASFISRQYARQCQKCLLRTDNLGVHLLCCCPRTKYEHLWTSVIGIQRVWKVDTQDPIRPV